MQESWTCIHTAYRGEDSSVFGPWNVWWQLIVLGLTNHVINHVSKSWDHPPSTHNSRTTEARCSSKKTPDLPLSWGHCECWRWTHQCHQKSWSNWDSNSRIYGESDALADGDEGNLMMIFDGHGGTLIIIDGHRYQVFGGRLMMMMMMMKLLKCMDDLFKAIIGYHPFLWLNCFFWGLNLSWVNFGGVLGGHRQT